MPIALLQGLSGFARQWGAAVHSLIGAGFTRSMIVEAFPKPIELLMRTPQFTPDLALLRKAVKHWTGMKFVGRDKVIRVGYEPTEAAIRKEYMTTFEYHVRNVRTGEEFDLEHSILHTRQRKRGLMEVEGWDTITEKQPTEVELISVKPVEGLKRL